MLNEKPFSRDHLSSDVCSAASVAAGLVSVGVEGVVVRVEDVGIWSSVGSEAVAVKEPMPKFRLVIEFSAEDLATAYRISKIASSVVYNSRHVSDGRKWFEVYGIAQFGKDSQ